VSWPGLIGLAFGCWAATAAGVAGAQAAGARPDEWPAPLSPRPGDALSGRAIVADRQRGLCLLCHPAPIPQERFQGNIGPDLAGVGDRWTAAQLRQRLIDPRRLHADSVMPAYFETAHLNRVGSRWQGRTVLSAEEIEDVIAYLLTLRASPVEEGRR